MSTKKKNNYKKKNEFRFHAVKAKTKRGKRAIKKHPTFIFLENGDIFIYVQLTHSKRIKGKVLIKLRKNPNPLDIRNSYYIEEICEDNKNNFEKKKSQWTLDKSDEDNIRKLWEK